MAEFNPYAPPEAEITPDLPQVEDGRGVWADDKSLVMARVAQLPARCVKCNAPASTRIVRKFSWIPPGWYFLLFLAGFGLIVLIVVFLAARKVATVGVPLCEAHRASRRRMFAIAWLIGLGGAAICVLAVIRSDLDVLLGIGLIALLGSLIFGAIEASILAPRRIDATHAWFRRAGPAYLASLPPLPTSVVEI